MMNRNELIRRLLEITEVTSRRGLTYTIMVSSKHTDVLFKRPNNDKEEKLPISELLALINSNKKITTTLAREYIKGRKQSPAVAIIDKLSITN